MEEQVLVKAKFKRNIIAYIMLAVGIVFAAIVIIFFDNEYHNGIESFGFFTFKGEQISYTTYYHEKYSYPDFILEVMGFNTEYSILLYCPLVFILPSIFLLCQMGRCEMKVTDKRVTGKASFRKTVDLPLNQISAIGLGIFNQICVATSSGRVHFWLVENREEVYRVLSEQLARFQATNSTSATSTETAPLSTADELRKYKELLDMGAITQEEFDAKKKELLGL